MIPSTGWLTTPQNAPDLMVPLPKPYAATYTDSAQAEPIDLVTVRQGGAATLSGNHSRFTVTLTRNTVFDIVLVDAILFGDVIFDQFSPRVQFNSLYPRFSRASKVG